AFYHRAGCIVVYRSRVKLTEHFGIRKFEFCCHAEAPRYNGHVGLRLCPSVQATIIPQSSSRLFLAAVFLYPNPLALCLFRPVCSRILPCPAIITCLPANPSPWGIPIRWPTRSATPFWTTAWPPTP